MEAPAEKKKELILFEGSLKDYAEMLLKDRRGDGSVINLGEIHETIVKELLKNTKSWGIIQAVNLNNPMQYRLIWEQ